MQTTLHCYHHCLTCKATGPNSANVVGSRERYNRRVVMTEGQKTRDARVLFAYLETLSKVEEVNICSRGSHVNVIRGFRIVGIPIESDKPDGEALITAIAHMAGVRL